MQGAVGPTGLIIPFWAKYHNNNTEKGRKFHRNITHIHYTEVGSYIVVYPFEFFRVFLPFIRRLEISNGYTKTMPSRQKASPKIKNPVATCWW